MKKYKLISLIFIALFSVSTHAGFFDFISDFFDNLFGGGNTTTTSPTLTRNPFDTPTVPAGIHNPAVRPCQVGTTDPNLNELEQEWQEAGYIDPRVTEFSPQLDSEQTMTHEMDLSTIVLRGSGWDSEDAAEHMNMAANVLAQCGIRVNSVTISEVDRPNMSVDFLSPDEARDSAEVHLRQTRQDDFVRSNPIQSRPVVVFARDTGWRNSAYANTSRTFHHNQDVPTDLTYEQTPRLNYTFISRSARVSFPRFSTVAHELAHLLCQCSHRDGEPNLLSTFPSRGNNTNRIPDDLCQVFKRSPLVNQIGAGAGV